VKPSTSPKAHSNLPALMRSELLQRRGIAQEIAEMQQLIGDLENVN
jgi:hypothetical protein